MDYSEEFMKATEARLPTITQNFTPYFKESKDCFFYKPVHHSLKFSFIKEKKKAWRH